MTQTHACPYCGKSQILDVAEGADLQTVEQAIVDMCDCEKAKVEQRKNMAKAKFEVLFGAGSESSGFEALDNLSIEKLTKICGDVLDGRFLNATITLPTGDRCRIAVVKDKIKIARENKNQAETKL